MSSMVSIEPRINLKFFRIAAKYINLIKLNLWEIAITLRGAGYELTQRLPPPKFRAIIGGVGPIAQKQNVIVDINTEARVIGVVSPSIEDAIREFNLIEELFKKDLMLELKPHFYEVLFEAEIYTKNNPIKILNTIGENLGITSKLSKLIKNLNLSLWGIRLCKKFGSPDDADWYEIEIIPSINRSTKAYYTSIVYRKQNRDDVIKFSKNLLDFTKKLLTELEALAS